MYQMQDLNTFYYPIVLFSVMFATLGEKKKILTLVPFCCLSLSFFTSYYKQTKYIYMTTNKPRRFLLGLFMIFLFTTSWMGPGSSIYIQNLKFSCHSQWSNKLIQTVLIKLSLIEWSNLLEARYLWSEL